MTSSWFAGWQWSIILKPCSKREIQAVCMLYIYMYICLLSVTICACGKGRWAYIFTEVNLVFPLQHGWLITHWCAILIAHQIVMAKHGGSCVHFSGISTCGRTSPETVSHPQRQPLPTACKISLPVYVIVTNKRLQLLATTLYNSLVLSFSLLKS